MNIFRASLPNKVLENLDSTYLLPSGEYFSSTSIPSQTKGWKIQEDAHDMDETGELLYSSSITVDSKGWQLQKEETPHLNLHKQFSIAADKLLEDDPLSSVIFEGWRSIDISNRGRTGARLIGYDETAGIAIILEFNIGPHSYEINNSIFSFDESDDNDFTYELSFLSLPQVQVASIWLRSAENNNLFFLLTPFPSDFGVKPLLAEDKFFSVIRLLVKEAIKYDLSPELLDQESENQ